MRLSQSYQANIVKAHGRNHAAFIFIRLNHDHELAKTNDNVSAIRKWLQHIGQNYITSHHKQCDDSVNFRLNYSYQSFVCSIALSYSGFKKARIPNAYIPKDKAFRDGMRHQDRQLKLGDNYETVEDFFKKIDCLLVISHNDVENLIKEVAILTKEELFQKTVCYKYIQYAFRAQSKDYPGQTLGPLNFTDGHSQSKSIIKNWRSTAVKEIWPNNHNQTTYGSYLALRKLKVDAAYFLKVTEDISHKLGINEDLAAALIIGRFRNGTPLIKYASVQHPEEWSFDGVDLPFDYLEDPNGYKCPVRAHVRVLNPRDRKSLFAPIVRRSMSYSENLGENLNISDLSKNISGLLFVSYQSDIVNQFESLFEKMKRAEELLTYPNTSPRNPKEIKFPIRWGRQERSHEAIKIDGQILTVFRGGEYFFAPSLTFLRRIPEFPVDEV